MGKDILERITLLFRVCVGTEAKDFLKTLKLNNYLKFLSIISLMGTLKLVEVDSVEIHVLVNDEIDQISPSPNILIKQDASFSGIPLDVISDSASRGGAKLEMPMHNICCGAHGLSLFIVCTRESRQGVFY